MSYKDNEFDMDPEYLLRSLNKKRGTGKNTVDADNDIVLTAPAPKRETYDPDDDEISAEEFARKVRAASGKSASGRTSSERSASGRSSSERSSSDRSTGSKASSSRTASGKSTSQRSSSERSSSGQTSRSSNSEMARRYRQRDAINREMDRREQSYKKKKKKKPKPLFWILLGIWALILIIMGIFIIRYVRKCLVKYENSQPENSIERLVNEFKDMALDGSILNRIELPESSGEFEDADVFSKLYLDRFRNISSITYAKDKQSYDTTAPLYDIYADDSLVAKMTLQGKNEKRLLAILKTVDWEIGKIEPVFEAETYDYSISIPSDYSATVNGVALSEKYLTGEVVKNPDFDNVSQYVEMPATVEYKIKNLVNLPDIRIYDAGGNEIDYTPDQNGNIYIAYSSVTNEVPADVKERSLEMAKTWQSFLLAELPGDHYGLDTATGILVKDSYYYNLAKEYASSVDITFISAHTAGNPEYALESVDEYKQYTDNCYSVHINLVKNMHLTRTGADTTDEIDSTYYFVYYDDTDDGTDNPRWLLADMIASTN